MWMNITADEMLDIMYQMDIGERVVFSDELGYEYVITRLNEHLSEAHKLYLVDTYGGGAACAFSDDGQDDGCSREHVRKDLYDYLRKQNFCLDEISLLINDEHVFNLTEYMKDTDDDDLVPWNLDEAINFSGSAGYGEEDDYWGKVNPVVIMLIWNSNFFKEIDRRKSKAVVMEEISKLKEKIAELERKIKEDK